MAALGLMEINVRLLALLVPFLLLVGVPALGANLTCTVPADNVTRGIELCEELRVVLRVRSTEWDNNVCATQFLRIGMIAGERTSSTRTARASVSSYVTEAVALFESTWPPPTQAVCGDGTLDTEQPFNETCDDGNTDNGDGCSNACGVE